MTVGVDTTADSVLELDEFFSAELRSPLPESGGRLSLGTSVAQGTILNDDSMTFIYLAS